jgi:DNA repair exonuclease SbcCD ATPase subunit
LNIEGETLRVKMSPLEEEMKQLPRVRAKLDEIDNLIKQFEKTRAKHTNDLIFYETMTNCPTCKQNIGEDHKTHILHTVNGKLEQIETAAAQIATKVDTYQEKMIQLLNKQKELTAMMMELGEINTSINVSHELIAKYQREIIDISNQTGNIDDERNKLNDMAKQAVALNNNKKKLLDERMYHDTIHGMLKDSGIKTRIIRQYIPVFNRLIDKYLQEMDLFVNFTLDENFNEVIKSRYRDIFTYGSFSAGEQQRIDLSMLFVFREIARLKNAVSTNLLIMDEVLDSHLEEKGVDSFFSIISKFDNTNIFVISHRENISDRFDSTIRLIKRNNFTNIE